MSNDQSGLPAKGVRLFHVIRELRDRGASQREALRAIRDRPAVSRFTGEGNNKISDKTLRAVWRRLEAEEKSGRALLYSRRDYRQDAESIPLVPVAGDLVRGRFLYRVRVEGKRVDGEKGAEFIGITSDETLTKDQIERRARRIAIRQGERRRTGSDQFLTVGRVRVVTVSRRF